MYLNKAVGRGNCFLELHNPDITDANKSHTTDDAQAHSSMSV